MRDTFVSDAQYRDKAKCPNGHRFMVVRRRRSVGKKVTTYCFFCRKSFLLLAGPDGRNPIDTTGAKHG